MVLEGREVWISRPADSEALLTDEAFEREEFLPYWADLWPSAIELAHVVARWDLAGRRVLELGCGLALPGIAAALRGGRVTVSDWAPDALGFARANAERNGVALEVVEVSWAEPRALLEGAPWDVVLAADVLYEQRNVDQLLDAAAAAGRRRLGGAGRSRPHPGPAVPAGGGGGVADRDGAGRRLADPHPHPGCGGRRRAAMMPSHR